MFFHLTTRKIIDMDRVLSWLNTGGLIFKNSLGSDNKTMTTNM